MKSLMKTVVTCGLVIGMSFEGYAEVNTQNVFKSLVVQSDDQNVDGENDIWRNQLRFQSEDGELQHFIFQNPSTGNGLNLHLGYENHGVDKTLNIKGDSVDMHAALNVHKAFKTTKSFTINTAEGEYRNQIRFESGDRLQHLISQSLSANNRLDIRLNYKTPGITQPDINDTLGVIGNLLVTKSIKTVGNIEASGTVYGGNIVCDGVIDATSDISTGGNMTAKGTITTDGGLINNGDLIANGHITGTGLTLKIEDSQADFKYWQRENGARGEVVLNGTQPIDLAVSGNIKATGTVTGGNVVSDGLISASSDISTGGDIRATGTITADGGFVNNGEFLHNGKFGVTTENGDHIVFRDTEGKTRINVGKDACIGSWSVDSRLTLGTGNDIVVIGSGDKGKVGIGTQAPESKLHVDGNIKATGQIDADKIVTIGNVETGYHVIATGDVIAKNGMHSHGNINADGNIKASGQIEAMGKILAHADFRTKSDIHCQGKVTVGVDALFPDYVFEDDYDLMPLGELEAILKKEKSLPGIPSAEEVNKAGTINLGEMNLQLLRKVEELTLYVIQLRNFQRKYELDLKADHIKDINKMKYHIGKLEERLAALEQK